MKHTLAEYQQLVTFYNSRGADWTSVVAFWVWLDLGKPRFVFRKGTP